MRSARIQTVLDPEPHGRTDSWALDVPQRGPSLSQAASFFRRSIQSDPALSEARVRLGRVLTLQGRLDEGAELLGAARARTDNRILHFWSDLFLGDLEDRRGRLFAAKAAYERARHLYPNAQSALLGLAVATSRIDPARTSTVDVWAAVGTAEPGGSEDPRVYHLCLGRPRASE